MGKPIIAALGGLGLALALAGCAQQQFASSGHHGKEYFPQGKYGTASPRVVSGGPVPKGGGQYLVGRPYHVNGRVYVPQENTDYAATGMASWYGDAFHGRRTANGEIYDMHAISAAHPTMPLPSYARVTNLANGNSIIVRVNDRGPYAAGRVMDVSSRVADLLGFKGAGTGHVHIEYVGRAPIEGSDDSQLASTLRTDGKPASLEGLGETMVASAAPTAPEPPPPPTPKFAAIAPVPAPTILPTPDAVDEAPVSPPPRAAAAIKSPLPPDRPYDLAAQPVANAPPTPIARPAAGGGALY